jgi:RNA polymerase sigma-70 factor (ECF subfamily)
LPGLRVNGTISAMATDAELLQAWRAGDNDAGSELIERYAPRLHRFFDTRVVSHADDLCQQTLEACVQGREIIEEDGSSRSFRSYVFGVARRKLLNHYRSERVRDAHFDALETSVQDIAPTASQHAASRQEAQLVASALRRLPIDYQITLELHYWEGLTTQEIATALDAPVNTVKTRLARGRDRLKEIIAALAADDAVRDIALRQTAEIARALGRA